MANPVDIVRKSILMDLPSMLNECRRVTPVRTGALRRSIQLQMRSGHDRIVIEILGLDYAVYQMTRSGRTDLTTAYRDIVLAQLTESINRASQILLHAVAGEVTAQLLKILGRNHNLAFRPEGYGNL